MIQEELFCDSDPGDCDCLAHNGFLTRKGYERVDRAAQSWYLDKVVSVSALPPESYFAGDEFIDEQYRRYLNGF